MTLGAVDIKFHGPEVYENIWRKTEAVWHYACKHYLNAYDYFHTYGEDAYAIPDNLHADLIGKQVNNILNGHMH